MPDINKPAKKSSPLKQRNTRRNEDLSDFVFGKVQPQMGHKSAQQARCCDARKTSERHSSTPEATPGEPR